MVKGKYHWVDGWVDERKQALMLVWVGDMLVIRECLISLGCGVGSI